MNDILSQEEIDALLRGQLEDNESQDTVLTPEEKDALGEIGNISMGTAATTLYTLLNNKVTITTPDVEITTMAELAMQYPIPFVAVEIQYVQGFEGRNLLIVKEEDVKIITDLMMGGDGTNTEGDLTELHLSAIGEAMNQMIGSASTSLATIFNENINISPPEVFVINLAENDSCDLFESNEPIVKINFKMQIGDILDSYMIQLIPVEFAKSMVNRLLHSQDADEDKEAMGSSDVQDTSDKSKSDDTVYEASSLNSGGQSISSNISKSNQLHSGTDSLLEASKAKPVDVRPVHFQPLEETEEHIEKSNIDLILDVPLEVSVEIGRTKKTIKEILELGAGSIIELTKMAGEPADILVNGKMIAKGEIVVIDDSFGVRVTDIISPDRRIKQIK